MAAGHTVEGLLPPMHMFLSFLAQVQVLVKFGAPQKFYPKGNELRWILSKSC